MSGVLQNELKFKDPKGRKTVYPKNRKTDKLKIQFIGLSTFRPFENSILRPFELSAFCLASPPERLLPSYNPLSFLSLLQLFFYLHLEDR